MTAARKAKRRPAAPAVESAVYAGSVMLGEIKPSARGFTARLATGRRLPGAFTTEQRAMKAITTAARAAPSQTTSEKA